MEIEEQPFQDVILPLDQRQDPLLELTDDPAPLNLEAVFGNNNPVEIEIGIGKGFFIMRSGQCFPDRNYIGIEYARKYLQKARRRITKRPLPNVRLVHGEALDFMSGYLPDASLAAVHLYFPDPWPKKRHHKRRLFNHPFLAEAHRVLQSDGELLIATDHADYWSWMMAIVEQQTFFEPSERVPGPPREEDRLTNYEQKYIEEGREIFRAGYCKVEL